MVIAKMTSRLQFWEDLQQIARTMQDTWIVLGDFSAALHPKERGCGMDVGAAYIADIEMCIVDCNLWDMRKWCFLYLVQQT